MGKRLPKTLADYVAIAISPALIMVLVGSLVFFLAALFYQGGYPARLNIVLGLFVFGSVLIARISIEQGRTRAAPFALALGAAVAFALFRFVEYSGAIPPGLSMFVNLALMAVVWWSADKLTHDCTVIDEGKKASSEGLMQSIGLDEEPSREQSRKSTSGGANPNSEPLTGTSQRSPAHDQPRSWWERNVDRKGRPHSPGLWVVYFSLAALPIFGFGQGLITADDVGTRRWTFWLFCAYLAAGLGLLVSTSFLGLRRYLRQRRVEMPTSMAGWWLVTGSLLVLALLVVTALLPRPGAEFEISSLTLKATSPIKNPSRFGFGGEGVETKNSGQAKSNSRRKPDENSPVVPGGRNITDQQGNQAGEENSSSGGEQSGGNTQSNSGNQESNSQQSGDRQQSGNQQSDSQSSNSRTSSRNQQQDNQSSDQNSDGQNSGQRDSQGDQSSSRQSSDNQERNDSKSTNSQRQSDSGENSSTDLSGNEQGGGSDDDQQGRGRQDGGQQSSSGANPRVDQAEQSSSGNSGRGSSFEGDSASVSAPEMESSSWFSDVDWVTTGVKWMIYLIVAMVILFVVVRYWREILRGFAEFFANIRTFLARLFGGAASAKAKATAVEAPQPSGPPPRPFSTYADPFTSGMADQVPPKELVRYSFEAFEAWARDHGRPRGEEETPHEFAYNIGRSSRKVAKHARNLADLYDRAAYAPAGVTQEKALTLAGLWRRLRGANSRSSTDTGNE